jgi:hypothetical protein
MRLTTAFPEECAQPARAGEGETLGQTDNLRGAVSFKYVAELINTECAHAAYQALSRGSCRTIENGHTKSMNAWLIHRDARIRKELEKVMLGAV